MSVYHNIGGTITIATGLPEPEPGYAEPLGLTKAGKPRKPRKARTTRVREIPVDPARFENCAVLEPEDHEEIGPEPEPVQPPVDGPPLVTRAIAAFRDLDEVPTLRTFVDVLDRIGMSRSVDLMIWLRRHRELAHV